MLQRLLIVILVLYALWRVLGAWGRRLTDDGGGADSYSRFSARRKERERRARAQAADPEQLVACRTCGIHVPRRRALPASAGAYYCSSSCREAGDRSAADVTEGG